MIKIENASKTFAKGTPNEVYALKNVTLTIEKGDFVTVIGTNGSGKSTLLNAIAGTLTLDEGRIKINNEDVTNSPTSSAPSISGAFSKIRSAALRRP